MGTTSRDSSRIAVIRAAYAALNQRDTGTLMDLVAPDAEFRFRPPGAGEEVLEGPDQLLEFYEALFRLFDVVRMEIRTMDANGDTVLAQGTVTLRLHDTGEANQANIRHTFAVRDGLIAEAIYDDPVNPLELMRAAAALPPEA